MPWKNVSPEAQKASLALAMSRRTQTVTALAVRSGACRQTAYRWQKRFEAEGKIGLNSRHAGRPSGSGTKAATWRGEVLALRRQKVSWGAGKLYWQLCRKHPGEQVPSARTIHRWLVQAGRVQRRRRALRCGRGISVSVQPIASNAVWTADFKGDIRTADGGRVVPLTVRDLFSRFVLAVVRVRKFSEAAVGAAFRRLFRRYGQPAAIRLDLGTPFCGAGPYGLTTLSVGWTRLGIEVQFVHRQNRIDNNAHEQMHRILKAEAATPPSRTESAQWRRLQRWRHTYNHARPHDALGKRCPAELYEPGRPPKLRLFQPKNPAHSITRRVRPHGWVKFRGSHRHIGRAFVNQVIAFVPTSTVYEVYYGNLLLGTVDARIVRAGLVAVASTAPSATTPRSYRLGHFSG